MVNVSQGKSIGRNYGMSALKQTPRTDAAKPLGKPDQGRGKTVSVTFSKKSV